MIVRQNIPQKIKIDKLMHHRWHVIASNMTSYCIINDNLLVKAICSRRSKSQEYETHHQTCDKMSHCLRIYRWSQLQSHAFIESLAIPKWNPCSLLPKELHDFPPHGISYHCTKQPLRPLYRWRKTSHWKTKMTSYYIIDDKLLYHSSEVGRGSLLSISTCNISSIIVMQLGMSFFKPSRSSQA